VELAHEDPESLLIFSGGQSRLEAGPRSEASSYYHIAHHHQWWGRAGVAGRTLTEEFARDSFENLLFGICRFKEYAGNYPSTVTLVSWAFKESRFHLHREAVGWPVERFRYEGPNNPGAIEQALRAEENAIRNYSADPYSASEMYRLKRRDRNPFRRQHGYLASCPELEPLFRYEGPELFRGSLPWTISSV